MRAKWSAPIRKYWKISEQMMVKYCDLAICDSVNPDLRRWMHYEKVQRLKLQGFTDWAMQHWTFANDHGQNTFEGR